jgi:hypothetical protein
LKKSHSIRTNKRPIPIIRRSCSDSSVTASQMDGVFRSDNGRLETFSGGPLVSAIMDRYFTRYGRVYSTPPSDQVRGLFERWSIKFSADYYERKDRDGGQNGSRLG